MCSISHEKSVRWKARDGFLCAATLIIASFATNEALWITDRNSHSIAIWFYQHRNFIEGSLFLTECGLSLLIVFLFARARAVRDFLDQVGLIRPVTSPGFFAAFVAIGFGFLALYGATKQWIPPNHLSRGFYEQGGMAKWFFIIYAVLIAPFCEEVVRRGFLYRAFRGSFTPVWSIFFVLCVHAYFHWGTISHSFYTFICLVLVEVWLCLIREWTANLWNCVLCHAVYNATQNLPWYIYTIGLILFLPYYAHRQLKIKNSKLKPSCDKPSPPPPDQPA
jgi:membrane protease YdiL (CAAX protease family)